MHVSLNLTVNFHLLSLTVFLGILNSTFISSTRYFHILILLQFHCVLIGVKYYHPVFSIFKSSFYICCIPTSLVLFYQNINYKYLYIIVVSLCSFHDVLSLRVFHFQFLCLISAPVSSILMLLVCCVLMNTYLLTTTTKGHVTLATCSLMLQLLLLVCLTVSAVLKASCINCSH